MKLQLSKQDKLDINTITKFLAIKDIDILDVDFIFDIMVIMPSAVLDVADAMILAYKNKVAKNYIIAGGIGHSTNLIRKAVRSTDIYKDLNVENLSEAEIYYEILKTNIPKKTDPVFLDIESTNCGSNASNSYKITIENKLQRKKVLLMQDPIMQRRTLAAFQKNWDSSTSFFNYVPFIPILDTDNDDFSYSNNSVHNLWDKTRLISLIMGEVLRLYDTEKGYGPKGKNYIVHVDVPIEILEAYKRLKVSLENESLDREILTC